MARKPVQFDSSTVTARVLPNGAGKVCTGEETAVYDEASQTWSVPTYGRGDTFQIARTIAEELEQRGLVEIQG